MLTWRVIWKAPICLGALVLGILLSRLGGTAALGMGIGLFVLLTALHAPHERGLRLFLFLVMTAGYAAGLWSLPRPLPEGILDQVEGRYLEGWGFVREFPRESTTGTQVVVDVTAIRFPDESWQSVRTGVRLHFDPGPCPQKGEGVHFAARLRRFHNLGIDGEFDEESREHNRGVFAAGHVNAKEWTIFQPAEAADQALTALRSTILKNGAAHLSAPSFGIFAGLVLGEQQRIERRIHQEWRDAGVTHLISISGLHLGIVFLLFRWLFARLISLFPFFLLTLDAGWLSGLLAMPAVVFYSVISGSQAPTLRSLSMLLCVLLSQALGRRSKGYEPLAWGALTMLAMDPQMLFSPGFQLSFTAIFGGLAWQHTAVQDPRRTVLQKSVRYLSAALISSLVAMAWTTPIAAYLFGRGSAVGLVANVPMIPYVSLILTPAAFLFACLSAAGIDGGGFWRILDGAIEIANRAASFFAGLPGAGLPFRIDSIEFTLTILALGAVSVVVLNPARRWRLRGLTLLLLLIFAFTLHEWQRWNSWRYPLRVDVLSVGQGDAVLLSSLGHHALVDTGGGSSIYERTLAPYWVAERFGKVDYLLLTHPHEDHVGGAAALLRAGIPAKLVLPSIAHFRHVRPEILAAAERAGIPIEEWTAGETHWLGQAKITVLHPSAEFRSSFPMDGANWNNLSLVVRVDGGDGSCAMLSGDAEEEAEDSLVSSGKLVQCDLLKAGHHGSRTSGSAPILDRLRPKWALISAGFENKFGHPHRSTLQNYQERQIQWRATSRGGTITAVFAQNHWEIQTFSETEALP